MFDDMRNIFIPMVLKYVFLTIGVADIAGGYIA